LNRFESHLGHFSISTMPNSLKIIRGDEVVVLFGASIGIIRIDY